jgi:hypothetical protein
MATPVTQTAKTTKLTDFSFAQYGYPIRPEQNSNFLRLKAISDIVMQEDALGFPNFFESRLFPDGMTRFIVTKIFTVLVDRGGDLEDGGILNVGVGLSSNNLVVGHEITVSATVDRPYAECSLINAPACATVGDALNVEITTGTTGEDAYQTVNLYVEGYFIA